MRIAVLGADNEVLKLAEAMVAGGDHELVAVYEAAAAGPRFRMFAPNVALHDEWQSMLHGTVADVVVVAHCPIDTADTDRRADQLRKLVQAEIPLLVVHPVCEAIVGYELDMIRADTQSPLVPYCPGLEHPELHLFLELAGRSDGPLGELQQLVFVRTMRDHHRQAAIAQLSRDTLLMQPLLGDVTKVHAIGTEPHAAVVTNLNVQMTSPSGIVARWSLEPAMDEPAGQLTAIGSRGRATLLMPAGDRPWQLTSVQANGNLDHEARPQIDAHTAGSEEPVAVGPDTDEIYTTIERFFRVVNAHRAASPRTDATESGTVEQPQGLSWITACRAQEAAETVDRSLKRGRTIELYHGEHSEESTFKGIMAVGSCGVLIGGFLIWIIAGVVEGIVTGFTGGPAEDAPAEPARWHFLLRLWPAYPFLALLLLQLLALAIKRPGSRKD